MYLQIKMKKLGRKVVFTVRKFSEVIFISLLISLVVSPIFGSLGLWLKSIIEDRGWMYVVTPCLAVVVIATLSSSIRIK